MKKLVIIAATVLIPFIAAAQFTLNGKITDKETGEALGKAGIYLENSFISALSDPSGNYILKNVKPGRYEIRVSYMGYKNIQKTIVVEGNSIVNFELMPNTMLADEVLVRATRAGENSGTTLKNVSKEELGKNNLGQDLPLLLNHTPSVVVSSDAGNGIGYTGIRIRGSDPTRINVTLNGIPYNDSESQGTFWVNMPDFTSSVDNIQIQRGVGTSTNGAGAFGGSLNIQTTALRDSAYAELSNSFGSYRTLKNTVNVGTGLINNQFTFDGRLSRIKSDGYIDRASSDLKSYFISGAFYGKSSLLRANVFSGTEKTYQAWNGIPESMLDNNRTFNSFTYDDQTDNYAQNHYQLLYSKAISSKISANAALHYTRGKGYYEEFKEAQGFAGYGILPYTIGSLTVSESDLIRRRWLDNHFYGTTYSLIYSPANKFNFTLGGAYNEYDGDHFGEVIRGQFIPLALDPGRYYQGKGLKTDFNTYAKADYTQGNLNLFADIQYRSINYEISGTDKNRNLLEQKHKLNFINPKIGVNYQLTAGTNIYASFAVANKEPNRDDYVNSSPATRPKSENLIDFEAGYKLQRHNFTAALNAYTMIYKDQLVLNGKINDVGEYVRQNVKDSYRLGMEFDSKLQVSRNLSWAVTAAVSDNKIKNFTEFVDDYDNGGQIQNNYKDVNLAFSPTFIGSSEITLYPFKKAEVALLSKHVSDQYLDNTSNPARKLDRFFVNDLRFSYNTKMNGLKAVGLTLLVNNVFSEKYESNGYTFSYLYGGAFTTENYYFPQAPSNFLLALNVKF